MTKQPLNGDVKKFLSVLDVTLLDENTTLEKIQELCGKVKDSKIASVCVRPEWVKAAKDCLGDTDIKICTVLNYPHGEDSNEEVAEAGRQAVANGAEELDVVVPYDVLPYDEGFAIKTMISDLVESCPKTTIKAIIETGALKSRADIIKAAGAAASGGADFIKTSTGATEIGATPEAVEAILDFMNMYPGKIGIKISGGVSSPEIAAKYWDQAEKVMGSHWCHKKRFRLGSSGLFEKI